MISRNRTKTLAFTSTVGVILLLCSQSTAANADETIDWVEYYAPTVTESQPDQSIVTTDAASSLSVSRDTYSVVEPPPPPPPPPPAPEPEPSPSSSSEDEPGKKDTYVPPLVTPDPGSAQEYAQKAVAARGWNEQEFACLVALWNRESGWRVNAHNSSSGAYGIPQALPGSKMASAGSDWETNPETQIEWGLGYIAGRFGTPCAAWQHSEDFGWY